jgi:transposase-like protein
LRTAITRNLVSFPAQIRSLMKRSSGDLQERIVQLYFVRGWPVRRICERYGLSKAMTHKLLAEWRVRAIESGYIQEIEPGNLAGLMDGTKSAIPEYLPAVAVAAQAPRLREFSYLDTMPLNTMPANAVPASIPTVKNPAAMSAGSGV